MDEVWKCYVVLWEGVLFFLSIILKFSTKFFGAKFSNSVAGLFPKKMIPLDLPEKNLIATHLWLFQLDDEPIF